MNFTRLCQKFHCFHLSKSVTVGHMILTSHHTFVFIKSAFFNRKKNQKRSPSTKQRSFNIFNETFKLMLRIWNAKTQNMNPNFGTPKTAISKTPADQGVRQLRGRGFSARIFEIKNSSVSVGIGWWSQLTQEKFHQTTHKARKTNWKEVSKSDKAQRWLIIKFSPWTNISINEPRKNPALLSMKSWLFNRDPYNGVWKNAITSG